MRLLVAIAVVLITVVVAVLLGTQIPMGDVLDESLSWFLRASVVILLPITAFVAAVYRYRKPRADQALVRTGGRQAKITISGGLWLNTIIHEVREIFLDTVRLDIIREGNDALITNDFLRADIEAAFFVRVEPVEDRVLRAAQSLGERTMTAEELTELLESKLEGALRIVAAEKDLKDLLQRRAEFAEAVQLAVRADLEENGLTLETVSLIRVDQTPLTAMNPDNQFDAQGIKKITEITQGMRRETEQIKLSTDVKITEITVTTKSEKLRLQQSLAWAEADQAKNITTYAAEREADTLTFQYEQDQRIQEIEYATKLAIERAKIAQQQGVQEREIEKLLGVETARIHQEQFIQEREIEKNLNVELAQVDQSRRVQESEIERMLRVETARIRQEQMVLEREIERDLGVETARIVQQQAIQVRDIERALETETARIDQERSVMTREIDKNLIVETAQIDQTRQVQEAEIERTLRVETARIGQEQSVKERDIERELGIQVAQIAQQEGVQIRDVERTLATETARIDQERLVMTRDIDKNLVVETAQIDQTRQVQQADISRTLVVEQARISQELNVSLTDEDRKIAVQGKQRVTELAERDRLEASALKTEAQVNVTAVQRTREAEWQREVAVINAEGQAQPIERIAEAILAEARAKAEGEMAHLQARNTAEQRVLVQEAVMALVDQSPRLAEQLMKPVERIQSIKVLDMGGDQGAASRNNMGRVANAILDTGVITPVLKELFNFADVDAQTVTNKIAEYLAALVGKQNAPKTS